MRAPKEEVEKIGERGFHAVIERNDRHNLSNIPSSRAMQVIPFFQPVEFLTDQNQEQEQNHKRTTITWTGLLKNPGNHA